MQTHTDSLVPTHSRRGTAFEVGLDDAFLWDVIAGVWIPLAPHPVYNRLGHALFTVDDHRCVFGCFGVCLACV